MTPRVVDVRAFVRADSGATRRAGAAETGAWQHQPIASPLAAHPGHEVRTTGGPGWVGDVVVEVEADDGTVGVGVTTGGPAACWVVEDHLAHLVRGCRSGDVASIWDRMWRGSLFYGRRGLVLHAISAVDLALWDLRGVQTGRPVHELVGGAVRERLDYYATTPDAGAARDLGFIGCKLPLAHAPSAGADGLAANVAAFASARAAFGDGGFLAYDCWMALDVEYAVELAAALLPYRPAWLEECLPPDDYWGHRRLRDRLPTAVALAGGEHEGTRWGFRALTELGGVDLLQPDPSWCGGLTELLRIIDDAEVGGRRVVMHGSSAYAAHVSMARASVPFAECILGSPAGDAVTPTFGGLFLDEPLPVAGSLELGALSAPGFGMRLDPAVDLVRPTRAAVPERP